MRFFPISVPSQDSGKRPTSALFSYTEVISPRLQSNLQLTKRLCLLGRVSLTIDFRDLPPLFQKIASEWGRRSFKGHIYLPQPTQQYLSLEVFPSHKVGDYKGAQIISCEYPPWACCLGTIIWASYRYTHSKWEEYPWPVVCPWNNLHLVKLDHTEV